MEEESAQNKTSKQPVFESLSKDDLIIKCKNLLGLLKKAKLSKDDALAEVDKLKLEKAKAILQLEDERNRAEEQTEVLKEMVSSLTESKMNLTTKNESLQRQLNLQISEVESLKGVEKSLLEKRENQLKEIDLLKVTTLKQQNLIDKIKAERVSENQQTNRYWEEEKLKLMDRIESLEAQANQTEVLKSKCKKLLSEKEQLQSKKSFEDEKKALEIVHNELKSQKIVIEDKYQTCLKENVSLKKVISQLQETCNKLSSESAESQTLNKKFEELIENDAKLKEEMDACREEKETLETELCGLRKKKDEWDKELEERLGQRNKEVEQSYNDLKQEFADLTKELLEERIKLEKSVDKGRELESKICTMEEELLGCRNRMKASGSQSMELKVSTEKLELELGNSFVAIEDLRSKLAEANEFYRNINSLFSPEEELLYHELVSRVSELNASSSETLSNYKDLEFSTTKLVSLVCHLFCLSNLNNFESNNLIVNVNSTHDNLQSVIKEFKESNLENLCNKCFLNINALCTFVTRLECICDDLVTEDLENTTSENSALTNLNIENLVSDELSSKNLSELVENMSNICCLLSKFFNFDLCSNFSNSEELRMKLTKTFDNFVKKAFTKLGKLKELKASQNFLVHNESILTNKIHEQNNLILSCETDNKALKEQINCMEKMKTSLEKSLKDIQNVCEDFKRESSAKGEEIQQKMEYICTLEATLNDAQSENEKLKESLNNRESCLSEKIKELEAGSEQQKLESEQLKNRLNEIEIELEESVRRASNLEKDYEKLQSEYQTLSNLSESSEDERKKALEKESKSSFKLEILNEENKNLKEKLSCIEREFQEKIDLRQSELEKLKEEAMAACSENENLHSKLETMKEFNSSDEIHKKRQCELESKCDLLTKENCDFKMFKEKINLENEILKKEKNDLSLKLTQLEGKLTDSGKCKESLCADFTKLEEENMSIKSESELLKEKILNKEKDYEDLCHKNNLLTDNYKKLQSEYNVVKAENDRLGDEIKENLNESQALREKLFGLEKGCDSLNIENKHLWEEIESMKAERGVSEESFDVMKEKYEAFESENFTLIEKVDLIKTDFSEYKKEAENKIISLENSLQEVTCNNVSICDENSMLKKEAETIQLEVQRLKNRLEGTEDHFGEIQKLRSDFENEKKEKEALNKIIKSLEKELGVSKEAEESLSKKLKEVLEAKNSCEERLKENVKCYETLTTELQEMKENKDKLEKELQELVQVNNSLKEDYLKIKKECETLSDENDSCKSKMKSQEANSVSRVDKLKAELEERQNELSTIAQENASYLEKMKCLENELSEVINDKEELTKVMKKKDLKLKELHEENELLKVSVRTLEAKVIGCVQTYKSIQEGIENGREGGDAAEGPLEGDEDEKIAVENADRAATTQASLRYTEIISELNEMNQVIRKRGEKISLMEDTISQKNNEIKELKFQLRETMNKLSSGEKELACKQEELLKIQSSFPSPENLASSLQEMKSRITTLEEENVYLKKIIESESCVKSSTDAQSEAMSTSTISRMEETQRMKELEDTFEERYMKLKSLAIKLKKKLAEQTTEMKALEETKQKLISEREEVTKKSHVAATKNAQILQSEIDRLEDSVESNRKELKEKEKQLLSSAQENSDLKSELVRLDEERGRLVSCIQHLEDSLDGEKSLNESFKGQVTALEKRLSLEEEKIVKLQEEQSGLATKLENEKKAKVQVVKELDEAKQETKKHSLIDLEMKDYERSIKDLTSQVNEKEDVISSLEYKLQNEVAKSSALSEEVELLKDQLGSETERSEQFKKNASNYKNQLDQLRLDQEARISEREKDRDAIENLNQELEKQKLLLAELSVQSTQIQSKLLKEKEVALSKVEFLEEKLCKSEQLVTNLRDELQTLEKEYEAYKIRAQSVLRQKSRFPQESWEHLKSEKEQLTADLEALRLKSHELQTELTAAKAEVGYLASEKGKLSLQSTKLLEELSKKEAAHLQKLDSCEKKLDQKCSDYQAIIANMSTQTEAMNRSFKSQLDSEKERHLREVQRLEAKLEECEEKLWQLKNPSNSQRNMKDPTYDDGGVSPLAAAHHHHHSRKVSHGGTILNVDERRIDVSNMVREEGEGSEWVEPNPRRSPSRNMMYSPPTLEQLINSPFPQHQNTYNIEDASSVHSGSGDFSGREIAKMESKVRSCEDRIQQLTTLLTESEAENAKLVQLSEALKEEIRRVSRNESREKHLENNEYLKNVVLKFLSLKTGDEKFRLVPVLKTLLQLSPEEVSNLTVIATGEGSQQQQQHNVPQGWGSYLHLWSGR